MRACIFVLTACMMILSSCKKDELQHSFEKSPKLLSSIKENNQLIAEFKYDNKNRLIQVDRYVSEDHIRLSEYYEYGSQGRLARKSYNEYVDTFLYNNDGILKSTIKRYTPNNREWKTEFEYKNGRLNKGIVYSIDGYESGYIRYKYDSRGNTIERTEYSNSSDYDGMIMSQFKYTYDEKINPYTFPGSFLRGSMGVIDLIQGNNPTYSYYYNINMSSLPPEYEFSYDYNEIGLPIKAYRDNKEYPIGSTTFEYNYIDKYN